MQQNEEESQMNEVTVTCEMESRHQLQSVSCFWGMGRRNIAFFFKFVAFFLYLTVSVERHKQKRRAGKQWLRWYDRWSWNGSRSSDSNKGNEFDVAGWGFQQGTLFQINWKKKKITQIYRPQHLILPIWQCKRIWEWYFPPGGRLLRVCVFKRGTPAAVT